MGRGRGCQLVCEGAESFSSDPQKIVQFVFGLCVSLHLSELYIETHPLENCFV